MQGTLPVIFSIEGLTLSSAEQSFFKESRPAGFILFGRNVDNPSQLRALTDSLRALTEHEDCPILIDQEGGRVARMSSPHWSEISPMRLLGQQIEQDKTKGTEELKTRFRQILKELKAVGINVNCVPVLDVLFEKTHDAIGDRAFSDNPEIVAYAGQVIADLCLEEGITPVMKHMPGHGRAVKDSHHDLPVVKASFDDLQKTDFYPFVSVAESEGVWGMMAHVIYESIDSKHPASVSETVISEIVRKEIGFQGLLLSDDLSMKALDKYGDVADRAFGSLQAGCDLALYCAGDLPEMEKIAGKLWKTII